MNPTRPRPRSLLRRRGGVLAVLVAATLGLPGCNFTVNGCTFSGTPAPVGDVVLYEANCPGADLSGAVLVNLWLHIYVVDADLSGANLDRSTIVGGVVSGASFAGARLVDTTWAEVTGDGVDLTGADLTGSSFNSVWFENSTFTGTAVVPADVTVPADGPSGAVVTWPTPPSFGGLQPGACDHPSGSLFPVGQTVVDCAVELESMPGNHGTFTVTVI